MQLDGSDIPGLDLRVTVQLGIEATDIQGERSGPDSVFKRYKPATVQVTLQIPMDSPEDLAALRDLFYTVDDDLILPHWWTVTDPTCEALGINEVQFTDDLRVSRREKEQLWDVAFVLKERRHQPERLEDRLEGPQTAQVDVPDDSAIERMLGSVEKIAAKAVPGGKASS